MNMPPSYTENRHPFEHRIILLIASWLTASSVLNILNSGNPDYFRLQYAGIDGLPFLLALTVFFLALILLLFRFLPGKSDSLPDPGRLLFLSWIFFTFSMMPWFGGVLPAESYFLAVAVSLILARSIMFRAVRLHHPADLIPALAGLVLASVILFRIPWEGYFIYLQDLAKSQPTYLPTLILGYFGLMLVLAFLFMRKSLFRNSTVAAVMLLAMGIQIYLIGRITVARYEALVTPTYDFGLFIQMFHSMAETFAPVTTLERNVPMSHFMVHVSPIYYLMLPFFKLWPDPAVLQILQAVTVGSGIVPMVLLTKRLGLSNQARVAFSLIYLCSPALIASNFYDLHENCFLAPLLLWLIYFLEKKNTPLIALFAFLVLMVKEDAALYIWALAAYFMLDRRMIRTGLTLLLVSGGYFAGAIRFLQEFGDGAMTSRFSGLIGVKEWSLLSVPYSVFRNPGFFLSKILNQDKLTYILQMLAPLGFMPLFSRKLARWILLIPLIVMNLIMDWQYQYDIRFQYNYGSWVLLLYMALLFVRDLESGSEFSERERAQGDQTTAAASGKMHRITAPALLIVGITSGAAFSASLLIDYEGVPQFLKDQTAVLSSVKASLDEIPPDRSVIATTFLTSYLAQRDTIYDLEYNLKGSDYYPADFVVIDLRPDFDDFESSIPFFLDEGYRIHIEKKNEVIILERTP